ncbi:MAG: TerC family protein [Ectothiorhodospiraceae bacterium]|nr:TerC family protein [Chromatiales bacterium]MCP5157076.1 TerC family protein [Ectothiorhodospiraceae bacterium]
MSGAGWLPDHFWIPLLQIIGIDIILSGDNAVVIALACRRLPPAQRRVGILLGAGVAVALRIVFATIVVYLLAVPYLKIVGGLLLLWIAVKLLLPEEEHAEGDVHAHADLWRAVRTVALADAVMSLDNVIGIAAAARGSTLLLTIGLLISIPLIIWGSTLVLRMLDRLPFLAVLGAGLLGWISGDLLVTDPVTESWLQAHLPALHTLAPYIGAVLVVVGGLVSARIMERRRLAATGPAASPKEDDDA